MSNKTTINVLTPSGPDSRTIIFPHCDARILHPPGECKYCDESGLQQIRQAWGICFTGRVERGKLPCPADRARTNESQNYWPGNRARSAEEM